MSFPTIRYVCNDLAEYFSWHQQEWTAEDCIALAFQQYEDWRDAHLTAHPDDEDLTETELIDLYYKETQHDTVAP